MAPRPGWKLQQGLPGEGQSSSGKATARFTSLPHPCGLGWRQEGKAGNPGSGQSLVVAVPITYSSQLTGAGLAARRRGMRSLLPMNAQRSLSRPAAGVERKGRQWDTPLHGSWTWRGRTRPRAISFSQFLFRILKAPLRVDIIQRPFDEDRENYQGNENQPNEIPSQNWLQRYFCSLRHNGFRSESIFCAFLRLVHNGENPTRE